MSYIIKGKDESPILHQGKEVVGIDCVNVVKSVDLKLRQLTIVGSDETVDRDGDIVSVSGWILEYYLKNPVFLWCHDYRSVPLGAAEKVSKRKNPSRLEFQIRFPRIALNPFADMILDLYDEKIINACSVGFIPYAWDELDSKDSERPVGYYGGKRFTKQELLELSGCAVPSNPSALQNAIKNYKWSNADSLLTYVTGKAFPELPNEDDILGELEVTKCLFVDETEAKVHQVPVALDGVDAVPVVELEVSTEPEVKVGLVSDPKGEVDPEEITEVKQDLPKPDFNIWMTQDAVIQFEEIPFGKVVLYGEYSDEKGIVIEKMEVIDEKDLEPVDKVGAVLSRKNREKLLQAKDALEEVLKEATDETEPVEETVKITPIETGTEETIDPQMLQSLLDEVKSLAQITKTLKVSFEEGVDNALQTSVG